MSYFQSGWQDALAGKPWRKGYAKWRPHAQKTYEEGRLAAIVVRQAGGPTPKQYDRDALAGDLLLQVNNEIELKRLPPA